MYIKNKLGEPIEIGPGNALNIEYFKKIKLDVPSKLEVLKKIVNVIHLSVVPYFILCFLYVLFKYILKFPF